MQFLFFASRAFFQEGCEDYGFARALFPLETDGFNDSWVWHLFLAVHIFLIELVDVVAKDVSIFDFVSYVAVAMDVS